MDRAQAAKQGGREGLSAASESREISGLHTVGGVVYLREGQVCVAAGDGGGPLALICSPGVVRRALELTGIDEIVPIYGSRDELTRALATLRRPG